METITRFIIAFGTAFRATDIGAYFAPMFRPMVTEQNRMIPIRLTQQTDEAERLRVLIASSRHGRRRDL